ncbi:hypothetical protein BDY19DRAFT_902763 [Irpex rosettiformis]|uniref:Uncharacterized protein n=1 Tax=Irpex rosettiformis TaxID=378272 RepID=A0ACB8UJ41_9APHY|nr:hypothetical protein BDY19DRAFT_902763 [Irpex rosettiformis]
MSNANMPTLGRATVMKRQESLKRPSTSSFSTHFHGHVTRRSRAHSLTTTTHGNAGHSPVNALHPETAAATSTNNEAFPDTVEASKEEVSIVREDLRHRQFLDRHGSKHHCFPRTEAPWPFSYDQQVLEQSLIDSPLLNVLRDSHSFVEFHGKPPSRCLDLGTGMGHWVVEAAQTFPECTFVGFDLTDIQLKLKYIEPSVAKRLSWVHGNFLNFPLPFADNEFDYIHLVEVALGVPENKWSPLFEELHRILAPGGVVEMLQQDARFPVLPRWFTDPIHEHLWHKQEALAQSGSAEHLPAKYIPTREVSQSVPHTYSLLEELYNAIFDSRFINRTPSAILPNYFLSVFSKVISPPTLRISVPPIAPPIPKGFRVEPQDTSSINGTTSDPLDPTAYFIPNSEDFPMIIDPPSAGSSETASVLGDIMFSDFFSKEPDICKELKSDSPGNESLPQVKLPEFTHSHTRSAVQPLERIRTTSLIRERSLSLNSSQRTLTSSPVSSRSPRRPTAQLALQDATQLGGEMAKALFRVDRVQEMGEGALFMHLYQAARMVYAAKEAMWEELIDRVDKKDPKLAVYGWKTVKDYWLEESRRKFEGLFEGYEHDMRLRLSFWHLLLRCGYMLPTQRALSGPEQEEENKLRQAILEARKQATEEEFSTPVRSFRLLIGVKRS